MSTSDFSAALAIEDVVGALVMLGATLRITTNSGFGTPEERWALFRRALYCSMSVALFALGLHRSQDGPIYALEFASHTVILVGVVVFPLMRALNWITQDTLNAFQGWRGSGRGVPE